MIIQVDVFAFCLFNGRTSNSDNSHLSKHQFHHRVFFVCSETVVVLNAFNSLFPFTRLVWTQGSEVN